MNRLPVSPLVTRGLELAEARVGLEELCKRLDCVPTEIDAWKNGAVEMSDKKFLELIDMLNDLAIAWAFLSRRGGSRHVTGSLHRLARAVKHRLTSCPSYPTDFLRVPARARARRHFADRAAAIRCRSQPIMATQTVMAARVCAMRIFVLPALEVYGATARAHDDGRGSRRVTAVYCNYCYLSAARSAS